MAVTSVARRTRGGPALRFALAAAACLSVSLGTNEGRADKVPDTVMLTNGGRVRGTVMEEDPQNGTSVRLADGSVKHLAPSEVKQVIYGGHVQTEAAPQAPPPPPMPTSTATPTWTMTPAPALAPSLPIAAGQARVSFEGSNAEVSLGTNYSCTCPCTLDVAPGTYEVVVNGRPRFPVVVPQDSTTVVRVRGGSAGLLVGGVLALTAGIALFAGGLSASDNCASATPGTSCVSVPATLEATGVLWGLVGISLTIVGAVIVGKTRVGIDRGAASSTFTETVAKPSFSVQPWATTEDNLHGGVAGLSGTF